MDASGIVREGLAIEDDTSLSAARKVELRFTEPGESNQNAYIERSTVAFGK